MDFLPENIERYVEAHTEEEPELLKQLVRETWQKVIMPRMLSGHVQGRFLSQLSRALKPSRILEIGTYTGYSAMCFAEGLAHDGELITIEVNDELQWIHRKYMSQWPGGEKIKCIYGSAVDVLPSLTGTFDLIFLDADKERYPIYYEHCLRLLSARGVLLIDNVLWSGKVATDAQDKDTKALQQLNDMIHTDARVRHMLLPLRDGMMWVSKFD